MDCLITLTARTEPAREIAVALVNTFVLQNVLQDLMRSWTSPSLGHPTYDCILNHLQDGQKQLSWAVQPDLIIRIDATSPHDLFADQLRDRLLREHKTLASIRFAIWLLEGCQSEPLYKMASYRP